MRIPIISHLAAACAVLLLTGCATDYRDTMDSMVDSVKERMGIGRITTEQEFMDLVVGKTFSNDQGSGMCHADETITGEIDGKKLTGYWYWEGEHLCRTIRLGDEFLGSDCQGVFVSGDKMTVVGNEGAGDKVSYRLLPPGS